MRGDDWTAVHVVGADRPAPLVIACEHASRHVPSDLADLGVDAAALASHAAWDIGAAHVARVIGELMQAPVVEGGISRLVYDCNRPPSAPDAIPARSEVFDIPGNRNLDEATRADRFRRVHEPYHAALAETCRQQKAKSGQSVALITIHSFTPVYLGQQREVELGFLHDATPALAQAAFNTELGRGIWRAALNAPYAAADGVTHTLARHAEAEGRLSVMVEIRNDLIAEDDAGTRMAAHLAETLRAALVRSAQQGVAG